MVIASLSLRVEGTGSHRDADAICPDGANEQGVAWSGYIPMAETGGEKKGKLFVPLFSLLRLQFFGMLSCQAIIAGGPNGKLVANGR